MEAASAQALGGGPGGGALNRLRSDRRLAERFRAGDDGAFAVLYERHRHRLLSICIGVVGSYEDAQDALQNALAAAAVSLRKSSPEDVRAWLSRVARNAAIDLVRARRVNDPLADDAPATSGGPLAQAEEKEEVQELVASLARLPEQQRTALVMRELGGCSYAEVAGALERDETAVRGLIARARLSLRAELEASELACATVREELAHQPDGRRRPAVVRRHLRACAGCRELAAGMRSDARVLRGLAPPVGLGLAGLATLLRLTRPLAVGGAVAKGAFGTGSIQAVVACAVCLTAAEGVRELVVEPAPRPSARGAVTSNGAPAASSSDGGAATRDGTAAVPSPTRGPSATSERRAEARRRTKARLRLRDDRGARPVPAEDLFAGGVGGDFGRRRGHEDGGFGGHRSGGGEHNAGTRSRGAEDRQAGLRSPWRGMEWQPSAGAGAVTVRAPYEPGSAPAEQSAVPPAEAPAQPVQ
jgi:RNA polymerase sigma factor (sigma-70 family)